MEKIISRDFGSELVSPMALLPMMGGEFLITAMGRLYSDLVLLTTKHERILDSYL